MHFRCFTFPLEDGNVYFSNLQCTKKAKSMVVLFLKNAEYMFPLYDCQVIVLQTRRWYQKICIKRLNCNVLITKNIQN